MDSRELSHRYDDVYNDYISRGFTVRAASLAAGFAIGAVR